MGEPHPRTYNPEHFARLFEVEDRHFWFRARNDLIAGLLHSSVILVSRSPKVLEVGCGTGNTLRVLEEVFGPAAVTGMDLFEEGLQYARQRTTCQLVCGDVCQPPFSKKFDVVCLFDVIEHLPDDLAILRGVNRLLVRNGILFLTVPAHTSLWSYFDELADHKRRYESGELPRKLEQTGFEVEYQSGFMMSLFPLLWIGRRLNRWFGRGGRESDDHDALLRRELQINPLLNQVLFRMISAENRVLKQGRRLPVGSSLLVIAKKVQETGAQA
jgi:SAM-dependent methyltransferase